MGIQCRRAPPQFYLRKKAQESCDTLPRLWAGDRWPRYAEVVLFPLQKPKPFERSLLGGGVPGTQAASKHRRIDVRHLRFALPLACAFVLVLCGAAYAAQGWSWRVQHAYDPPTLPYSQSMIDSILHTVTYDREQGDLFHLGQWRKGAIIDKSGDYLLAFQSFAGGYIVPHSKNQATIRKNGDAFTGDLLAVGTFTEFTDGGGSVVNMSTVQHLRRGDHVRVIVRVDTVQNGWYSLAGESLCGGCGPRFTVHRLS